MKIDIGQIEDNCAELYRMAIVTLRQIYFLTATEAKNEQCF